MKKVCILSTVDLSRMTLLSLYTEYLHKNGIAYDIICAKKNQRNKDRYAANIYEFDAAKTEHEPVLRKLLHFWRMRRMVSELFDNADYDFIVVWNQVTAFIFSDILKKRFHRRYCVNIRDYHYDNFPIIRTRLRRTIQSAAFNTISSDAFRRFLPEGEYIMIHSLNEAMLSALIRPKTKRLETEPIRILNIGQIRWVDNIFPFLDRLSNDNRYEMYFIGSGSEAIAKYIEGKNIENVFIRGRFPPEETSQYLKNADIIFNLYGSGNPHLDTALSIKLYYAVYLGIPILTCKNTYMNELSRQLGIGYPVEKDKLFEIGDNLFEWYHSQNKAETDKACDDFIAKAKRSHAALYDLLDKFLAVRRTTLKAPGKQRSSNMINVIGLGYIGLPTALIMASHGIKVVGTDYNKALVATLNSGKTTFKEKGLDRLFSEAVKAGVRFTTDYQVTDTYVISVPTPYDKFSKKVDASYVTAALKTVMEICPRGAVVVIESTVSPGTIDKYIRPVIEENGFVIGKDLHLVHAPERILPGNMVHELLYNNRTVGADSREIGERIKNLYAAFCQGEIVVTDIRTAEMTKVVENTFRAVNIAFANELAKICRHDNMDVYEIIKICNMHPRVNILQPGPGVGGHCISVDPWFLVGDYPGLAKVIDESMKTNDGMPDFVLNRIHEIMKENNMTDLSRVGLYGLTYKENVDDYRESPTLQLLESQERHLAPPLKSYDPFIVKTIVQNQYHDLDGFLADIDLAVIMVNHKEIIENMEKLNGKIVFDTRRCCDLPGVYRL